MDSIERLCYIDLLREALTNTRNPQYIERIPALPLYLELGASSDTAVSLIGLGLSRTTAMLLNEIAPNKDMSRQEATDWLRRQNLNTLPVPEVSLREIRQRLPT
jgi:hypothetical protein